MLLGTIALQSAARMTGMTVPADYTMFVFDDALALAPLGKTTGALKIASLAKNTHGVAQVAKFAGKRVEKKQRTKQQEAIDAFPPELTAEQLTEHLDDAHHVTIADIQSMKATTGAPLAGHMRAVLLQFSFTSKDEVDPYMYKRLNRQRQCVSGDAGPAIDLLVGVLGDKVVDGRRSWGKK